MVATSTIYHKLTLAPVWASTANGIRTIQHPDYSTPGLFDTKVDYLTLDYSALGLFRTWTIRHWKLVIYTFIVGKNKDSTCKPCSSLCYVMYLGVRL